MRRRRNNVYITMPTSDFVLQQINCLNQINVSMSKINRNPLSTRLNEQNIHNLVWYVQPILNIRYHPIF